MLWSVANSTTQLLDGILGSPTLTSPAQTFFKIILLDLSRANSYLHHQKLYDWKPVFRATQSQPTKQPKKAPPLAQAQYFLFFYPVPFKLITIQFVTFHKHTNRLLLYTNIEGFPVMHNRSTTDKMRLSLLVFDPAIILLSSNTSTDLILHKIRSVRIAAWKNKISFTGSANARL